MKTLIKQIKAGEIKLFITPKSQTPYVTKLMSTEKDPVLKDRTLCDQTVLDWGFTTIHFFVLWYTNNGFKIYTK
jgi:hypothetical protein